MKKFGIYCSGGAGRIIKFYQDDVRKNKYKPVFIYYDGTDNVVKEKLAKFKPDLTHLITLDETEVIAKEINQKVSNDLFYWMKKLKVDYLFCFGRRILKDPLNSDYKMKIINFHPSLLPAFPGLKAIDQALNSSVQILGNTAHFIDEGIDTGPILLQTVISRRNYNNYDDVLDLQIPMLQKIWNWLGNDEIEISDGKIKFNNEINHNQIFYSA